MGCFFVTIVFLIVRIANDIMNSIILFENEVVYMTSQEMNALMQRVEENQIRHLEDVRMRDMINELDQERQRRLINEASRLRDSEDSVEDIVSKSSSMAMIGAVLGEMGVSSGEISPKEYVKLSNQGLSTKDQRVVINAAKQMLPDQGDPYYLLVASYANDCKTDDQQCGTFLIDESVRKDDKTVNVRQARYSQKQYGDIMIAANCDGDRPVINADLQVNPHGSGLRIVSNSATRPNVPFDAAQHKTKLKQAYAAREYEQKLRADAREIKQFEQDSYER